MLSIQILSAVGLFYSLINIVIYHVLFHPLARYPGPFVAKVTGWYGFRSVRAGDHHLLLNRLHERYGSVVRVGPNRLSFNSVEALQDIYGDRKANVKKAGFTECLALLHGGTRNVQTINELSSYIPRRKLISRAFSEEALKSSERCILEHIRLWCQKLSSKSSAAGAWTGCIDINLWASLLTVDILGELCFNTNLGAIQEEYTPYIHTIIDSAKQAQILSYVPCGPRLFSLFRWYMIIARKFEWAHAQPQLCYERAIDRMIVNRSRLSEVDGESSVTRPHMNFYDYVQQATDPETQQGITPAEINVEMSVLFSGGVDTSAACIAACMFYLTRHPDMLHHVTQEVRSAFTDVEEIRHGPQLNSLVYLRACIDETLRLSPGAPGPMVRKVLAGGLLVENLHVPEGTEISVPAYVIHHNPTYFPDPWAFRPNRWILESDEARREAFIPFSLGTRSCIGRNLAYLDITLAISRLLFLFDVRAAPGDRSGEGDPTKAQKVKAGRGRDTEYQLFDFFITARKGPVIQLRSRPL